MAVAIDETGNRYGKLTVLGRSARTGHGAHWVCECDCGNFSIPNGNSLRAGTSNSCGCNRVEAQALPEGEALFNRMLRGYKNNSRLHNREFSIEEDFRDLVEGNCFYCGIEPSLYNGIDRRDNSQGYTRSNSVSCCETCNRAKLKMGEAEFLSWVERISEHQYKI